MKSLKLMGLMALTLLIGMSFTDAPVVKTLKANLENSIVNWKGYKVTGSHEGTLKLKDGELTYTDEVLTGGFFIVDMTTISSTDLTAEQGKEKLEGHLKSADFFGVERYPTARFDIAKVVSRGAEGDYRVSGNLTIKASTKAIRFNAIVKKDMKGAIATAAIKIDRTDFDVRYGSGSFFDNLGDKTIYDEFDLNLTLAVE